MLVVRDLEAGYGQSKILFGISLDVGEGEVATLIGRNGMGKTTTIRAIMGMLPARAGEVRFSGARVSGLPSHRVAKAGLGLVPEGRQVFPTLTVGENLRAVARRGVDGRLDWDLPRVFATFPRLGERVNQYANTLSGGEQQMLAIGRALMTNPRLLILDEATEGLAPLIRTEIWRCLATLKSEGQSILVVDKNLDDLMKLANRHYVIEKGRVVWSGSSSAMQDERALIEKRIGV
jgi:branched-chain amino acid transport system ATP-binding protein